MTEHVPVTSPSIKCGEYIIKETKIPVLRSYENPFSLTLMLAQ